MLGSFCHRESRVLVDSLIVPQCIHKPGSFTGLMTMYESNYLKLERLLETIPPVAAALVSRVGGDCDLHLSTVRREPYTTTLKLTYWFTETDAGGGVHVPVLQDLALEHSVELDRRWQVNVMLNKWLDYLLDRGHRFR
jgi:uncharacterized protein YqiB (DUF1249 family)